MCRYLRGQIGFAVALASLMAIGFELPALSQEGRPGHDFKMDHDLDNENEQLAPVDTRRPDEKLIEDRQNAALDKVEQSVDLNKQVNKEFLDVNKLHDLEERQSGYEKASQELIDKRYEKGNFGIEAGNLAQAERLGRDWVGENARLSSNGKVLISKDGTRRFRGPEFKPDLGKTQANFERYNRDGERISNGHMDILN